MGSMRKINPYPGRLVYAVDEYGRCTFSWHLHSAAENEGTNANNRKKSTPGRSSGRALSTLLRVKARSADQMLD